ncbi:hypothetical protein BKA65DRAFT_471502 [Rhexocercosporidium sp. MPI-PUGE-AT-0058]|nr:hypothetical protein BKA65DRAFT_471502 [Rhexocercosporidium sp. MPI-PUGE-AT-0058]
MKDMFAYLRKLERMGDPPGSKRAARLLEKWATSLEKEGQTTSSTGQPIKHGGVGLNPVAEEHKHSNTADSQKPLDNGTQTPATGLVEECVLDMVIDLGQSTSDRSDESTAVPANEQTQHTPAPSLSLQDLSKSKPERVVIDLTDDDEVDMATGLGLPGQPTDDQNLRHSVAKSTQVPRSPSPSSTNSEPISTTARKIPAGPKSDSAKLDTKKRKRSDATNRERALVSASKFSAGNQNNDNTPRRQRPQRKTSPGQHLINEIQWMSESVSKIEKIIEETEEEIDTIKEKRVRLLKENEAEMQAARRRMNESINLKEYLLAWGAQDKKVTEE